MNPSAPGTGVPRNNRPSKITLEVLFSHLKLKLGKGHRNSAPYDAMRLGFSCGPPPQKADLSEKTTERGGIVMRRADPQDQLNCTRLFCRAHKVVLVIAASYMFEANVACFIASSVGYIEEIETTNNIESSGVPINQAR